MAIVLPQNVFTEFIAQFQIFFLTVVVYMLKNIRFLWNADVRI